MRLNHIVRLAIPCLFFLVLIVGCSKNSRVTGKVSFEDGTPLTKGEVTFLTATFAASGAIQQDGSYELSSISEKDGVPDGTYEVTVKAMEYPDNPPEALLEKSKIVGKAGQSLVDIKFGNGSTSGLSCVVKGSTKYDIKVTPPKKKP